MASGEYTICLHAVEQLPTVLHSMAYQTLKFDFLDCQLIVTDVFVKSAVARFVGIGGRTLKKKQKKSKFSLDDNRNMTRFRTFNQSHCVKNVTKLRPIFHLHGLPTLPANAL